MERRKLTTLDKLKIVVAQARCPLCGEKLGDLAGLDFDHQIALVNGGPDTLDNLRAVHREGCHKRKTHGNGATNRGSDRGEAIKSDNLEKKRLAREAKSQKELSANSEFIELIDVDKSVETRKFQKPKARIASRVRPPRKPQARATGYRRKGV